MIHKPLKVFAGNHWRLGQLVLICALPFLASCASKPAPSNQPSVAVNISAASRLNPDLRGRSSPVRLVIYQLKSSALFDSADFASLSQKDAPTLGADMLAREEVFVQPGDSQTIVRKLQPETTALAAYAEFRDIDKTIWRSSAAMLPVTPPPAAFGSTLLKVFQSAPKDVPRAARISLDEKGVSLIVL